MIYRLGWIPDVIDLNDKIYTLNTLAPASSVYLSSKYKMPAVTDQGNLFSNTAHSIAFLINFNLLNRTYSPAVVPFQPSRLFIYYNQRIIEGTVNVDVGAQLRNGFKSLFTYGATPESLWNYNIMNFNQVPSSIASTIASKFPNIQYERVDNMNKLLLVNALLNGFPIAFGICTYYSFYSDQVSKTGIIPLPRPEEFPVGGHSMVIVGYQLHTDSFIVRNSWGGLWGQGGYCRIPANYLTNPTIAADFWILKTLK